MMIKKATKPEPAQTTYCPPQLDPKVQQAIDKLAEIKSTLRGPEPEWIVPKLNPKVPGANAGAY